MFKQGLLSSTSMYCHVIYFKIYHTKQNGDTYITNNKEGNDKS